MDYVVFGIGFGATILVLGLLLRDFGPRLRHRAHPGGNEVLSAEQLVSKVSWARFCTALGSVLALAGAVFLIVTLVSMILVVSDDTGLWVMGVTYGLLIALMAYWTWAYFNRFGSYGILPERLEKPEPAVVARPRQPAPARTQDVIGPAVPAGVADPAVVEAVPVAAEAASEPDATQGTGEAPAVELASETPESPAEPAEGAASEDTGGEPAGETEAAEPRLETPEERLAHHETPIEHGSAEGDLDLAASPRRPGPRHARNRDDEGDSPSAIAGPPVPADLEKPD